MMFAFINSLMFERVKNYHNFRAINDFESVHIDGSHNGGDDAIPITMQSNADYSSVHPKVKKKSSGFNLKNLGAALK
jgi:hypothetical protein